MRNGTRLPTLPDLDAVVELLVTHPDDLYVRWSLGPDVDVCDGEQGGTSRDSLTGVRLPGLSANPLAVEPWWEGRTLRLWVARRLYDYRHLRNLRGEGTRPWVMHGEVCGRGPDNEPLVRCLGPVAWISDQALTESERLVEAEGSVEWGPLDRRSSR
ncbi:DUF6098 family protein [Cryptosporangium minutisporangium]|uniref:DUF6098 family protein n=1 Tax=Cryptosporangium minutisporangium TaxID=113569 RepID=UPI0031ED926C